MRRIFRIVAPFLVVLYVTASAPIRGDADSGRLLAALRGDDTTLVRQLLDGGADANARDENGASALMYAAFYASDAKTLTALIDRGADVNAANANGSTPLMWAAGRTDKMRVLIERGAALSAATKGGMTPLLTAARVGNVDGLRLLLGAGANRHDKDKNGTGLLQISQAASDPELRRLVESAGVRITTPEALSRAPVLFVIQRPQAVARVLQLGADANEDVQFPGASYPAAGIAAFEGRLETLQRLLDHGADPNRRGSEDITPLMMAAAASRPRLDVVRLLHEHGAELEPRDASGRSALDWALTQGETPVTQWLRKAGARRFVETPAPVASHVGPGNPRDALARAIAVLEEGHRGFVKQPKCNSCHAENLPGIAAALARPQAVPLAETLSRGAIETTEKFWRMFREDMLLGRCSMPGFMPNVAYGLLHFAEEGLPATLTTDAIVYCLAASQSVDGSWSFLDVRPPLSDDTPIMPTALAIHALSRFAPAGHRAAVDARVQRAHRFLLQARPADTQDYVFRLLGLLWAGAPRDEIDRAARALRGLQRADGGWGQWPTLPSDAYATGQTLYALHAAGLSPATDIHTRAITYLVDTQQPDGSWLVRSRAFRVQPACDCGFPHGRDQFISAAATAWAAIALALEK